jgi:chromosome segregation ATPase
MQTNQGHVVSGSLPTRIDKALEWLTRSRDTWKEKCKETKLLLKRQIFAGKRLKEGRDAWRLSSIQLKQELVQSKETITTLRQQIQKLETQVEILKNETLDIKKKSSHPK